MMGEGEGDQQSCEEAVVLVGKRNVWGDANSGDLVIKKSGLKGALPKHILINKEVPVRITGKILVLFLGNQHGWLPLKCLCSHAYSVGCKEEELHVCMEFQSYDFIGIMKI